MTQPDPQNLPVGGRFDAWLDRIARRWRLRRLAEAGAVAATLTLLILGGGIAYMADALFAPEAVDSARRAILGLLPLVLLIFIPPLWRRLSHLDTARYIEAADRDLDALAVSATLVGERSPPPGSLEAVLLAQAAEAVARSERIQHLEQPRLRRTGNSLALVGLLALVAALWGLAPLLHGLGLLFDTQSDPVATSPYQLRAEPGDAVVAERSDLTVSALPEGFWPEAVTLHVRSPGAESWQQLPMTATPDSGSYQGLLLNLETPQEYYVSSGPVRSTTYRVDVATRPEVRRIDLYYTYPPYTGRPPELVENSGPIRAVRGTRVEIRAIPDRPVSGGELVLDGDRRLTLQASDGQLRHTVELNDSGSYRIELPVGTTGLVAGSPEYPIEVHADDRPRVALEAPGRDARVTPIEELTIALSAEDDVAVQQLELVLNINGGEERVVPFSADPANPTRVEGRHPLALEEMGLQPGDLISYHARARDAADDPARLVTTDLYFLDVRPYEKVYRQARGGGGGGGGGGAGQSEAELTAQQRSLVVALFKLLRDRSQLEDSEFADRINTLKEAQARIRDRVDAIVRRLAARSFMFGHEGYKRMGEELPKAARAMVEAESMLALSDPDNALPGARQALLHLQRADAAFREVQISMQGSQGGGQANGSQTELSNLFRLEMDRFRNPYQNLQRGNWEQPQQALDDALNKLRELARRQQREIERARLRGEQGAGGRNSQQQLAEEVAELMRQLERLSRHRDPARAADAQRALEQLRSAQQAMEQAARSGDTQAGRQALDRLRNLQRELENARGGSLAADLDDAAQRAQAALDEQRRIGSELDEALRQGEGDPRIGSLAERKRGLADGVEQLGNEVERLHRRAEREQAEATRELDAAARALRQRRIAERMRESANALMENPQAQAGEPEAALERDLEAVQERLADAASAASGGGRGADAKADTAERLRSLVRGMKADQQRLADAANQAGGSGSPSQSASGQPGGGDQSGAAGGAPDGGYAGDGPVGQSWGNDSNYPVDFSGIRQEILDRMRRMDELDESFAGLGDLRQDISSLVSALDAMGSDPSLQELQALRARQAELLYRAQALELATRQGGQDNADTLIASQPAPVPPRWQSSVEEYFRQLGGDQRPVGTP